ncbi:GDP-fucose protein O-fucosyltransferase [Arabidopsis suecica]|uniref:O-fucosyltransferase family protein n=1 Tax=Arabidopsis suecica TaxID=45249 RepID=A0A8T2BBG0_ARASU|nr:GDP-fucose protein O-fucosyltransferase [Arabidopsis suecica]
MGTWKTKNGNTKKKISYISVPAQIINSVSSSSLHNFLDNKSSKKNTSKFFINLRNPKLWAFSLFLLSILGISLRLGLCLSHFGSGVHESQLQSSDSNGSPKSHLGFAYIRSNTTQVEISNAKDRSLDTGVEKNETFGGDQAHLITSNGNVHDDKNYDFWKQPDGLGYKPCLDFSIEYRRESKKIVAERRKYLMVVVSGGLNQQKIQIVDAVVIARILGAVLVVPILQINLIWGDESEFSDIFDLEQFKSVLANDVKIVSLLPASKVMTRPSEDGSMPFNASPQWIRSHYLKRFNREGVLLLRRFDSRLSKDLPSDLQKLRCKVAFKALKFAPRVMEMGTKLAERMRSKGPYIALHLRMEKDVWVRTGCLSGLSSKYDEIVNIERIKRPELLTAKSSMTSNERKLAGLCPLNAKEVTRLLRALGAPRDARIYWAGGEPLGGKEALKPLTSEFPHLYNKYDIALPLELKPFAKRASIMAAIDYIVCKESDVFMASHGGNMGHAIQGHRAYEGHKKIITPNKRHMLPYFVNSSMTKTEFEKIIKKLHRQSLGQPELRISKAGRDVTKYPVPECMCKQSNTTI